ncbi:MAG: GNAT family N-acetyltransferase [Sphingobacteriales bacterium]|nr:MAG: GNAT family N-acetyltransferase [Sphingobacteriales bacterium]
MSTLTIEQIRHELTWRMRHKVLYPDKTLAEMAMEEDLQGIHFGAFGEKYLLAVVSLFQNGTDYQFRKLAVDPDHQKQGIGSKLLQYITDYAKAEGGTRIWCNARLTAIDFYAAHGFTRTGNFFTRNGFEYEIIEKPLA